MGDPLLKMASAALAVVLVLAVLATGAAAGAFTDPAAASCTLTAATSTPTGQGAAGTGLDAEQWVNATTIVEVAGQLRLPARAAVIAIATALQESGLRNLPYGDRDSLGLFQQRPSQGWGTPAQIMDPAHAATVFYTALVQVTDWQNLPLTIAAQQVQRSGAPTAYAKHEALATAVVAALAAGTCPATAGGTGSTAAQRALAYALAQVGLPYQWAGNGPTNGDAGFDCSGLTAAAYNAAGIILPRTAQTQYDTGPLLTAGTPMRAGDLLYFGTPTHVHHVGIYTGTHHQMVDAAHTGTLIRLEDYTTWPDLLAASRPAP